jgi:ParB/RepB/Spo0J family partition protein
MSQEKDQDAGKEQLSLLPARIPKGKFARVHLSEFKGMQLIGPAPTADLVATVSMMGVFEPIIIFKPANDGRYKIGAGIRRIKAAQITEQKDIPAMIYEDEENFRNAITLVENNTRSANPLAEVRAIMRLQKKFSVSQIAQALHLSKVRVEERLRLNNVIKPLYDAMFKGQIAVSIGAAASRLPVSFQKQLAVTLKKEGKLTQRDVKEVKEVRRDKAVAALPKAIFADPPKAPAALNGQERELLSILVNYYNAISGDKRPDVKALDAMKIDIDRRLKTREAIHA